MVDNKIFEDLIFRPANIDDIPAIVDLIYDDEIYGKSPRLPVDNFREAFVRLSTYSNLCQWVVEFNQQIIGTAQTVIIPCLSLNATTRLEVEGVRIKSSFRGHGLGSWMFAKIKEFAINSDCGLIQLTTRSERKSAQNFYRKLGFIGSHIGMKYKLK